MVCGLYIRCMDQRSFPIYIQVELPSTSQAFAGIGSDGVKEFITLDCSNYWYSVCLCIMQRLGQSQQMHKES